MLFDDLDLGFFKIDKNISKPNLYSPEEGLLHGNMFPSLYKPYKNYSLLKIIPKNEKEALLLKLFSYDFALNDLNLYLDNCPQDEEMYKLFKEYTMEYEKYKKQYEMQYGPLCLTDVSSMQYVWYKNPWPWDSGEAKYV